ncbi:MAG: hypothetical protein ACE5MG_10680 [Candidatus Methylomirabilales bacterium]
MIRIGGSDDSIIALTVDGPEFINSINPKPTFEMTFLNTRRRRFQAIFPIVQTAEHTAGCLLHAGTEALAQEQYAHIRQAVPLKF